MPGLIIIGMGLLLGQITGVFKKVPNQKNVEGTIVSVEHKRAVSDGRSTYAAFVEYKVDKQIYCVKSRWYSATFRVGDNRVVSYDEQHPEKAVVRPKLTSYIAVAVFLISGAVIALLRFLGQI